MTRMTTHDREHQLVATIEQLTASRGFPPTMRECAVAMNVSLARVAQLVAACDRQGAVTRHPKIARSLRVIRPIRNGGAHA